MNDNRNIIDWGTLPWREPLCPIPVTVYDIYCITAASYVRGFIDATQFVNYTPTKRSIDFSEEFNQLKQEWETATAILSDINEISMHSAYQRIIGMGSIAVPLIICEMSKKPNHWFWALKAITGEDPVPVEKRGNIKEMNDIWLDWWEKNKEYYE